MKYFVVEKLVYKNEQYNTGDILTTDEPVTGLVNRGLLELLCEGGNVLLTDECCESVTVTEECKCDVKDDKLLEKVDESLGELNKVVEAKETKGRVKDLLTSEMIDKADEVIVKTKKPAPTLKTPK